MGRGEADDLRAEADLPLDELLAKYQTPAGAAAARNLRKKENLQSPAVKAKQNRSVEEAGPSSSTDTASNSSGSNSSNASSSSCARLTNGLADNENNLNKEKELQDTISSESTDTKDGGGDAGPANVSGNSSSGKTSSKKSPVGGDGSGYCGKSAVRVADSSSGSGDAGGSGGCSSSSAGGCDVGSSSCSSGQSSNKSSGPPSDGVSSSTSCVSVAYKFLSFETVLHAFDCSVESFYFFTEIIAWYSR